MKIMDSYENYYKSICRVCLSYRSDENMVCLTNQNSKDGLSCYGKAVEMFANVSINIQDELPQSMCQTCLLMLKQAIKFKLKCESSDKTLLTLFKHHKVSASNLKEVIVDFSMFRDNFPQAFINMLSETKSKDEPKFVNEEIISKIKTNDEELSFENEDNVDQIQDNTDDNLDDSADEILDQIEKRLCQFSKLSKSDYIEIPKRNQRQNRQVIKKPISQNNTQPRKRLKVKTKTETYVCKVCQKVLANQNTFNCHMQRHNGCKFICEHCGKGFPLLVELQMHQVTSHGTGPYFQCQHCPYKAPSKFTLTEHIRIHTGERPYTCDKCGLTFRRRAIWTKHMIYHREKTVQCPNCPRKFYRVAEMQAHSNSVHERIYVYLCHKCDTTYAKTGTVRRHLTERHGIPREMQGKIIRITKGKGTGFPQP